MSTSESKKIPRGRTSESKARVVVVMGVSGSGKTTIGEQLADVLGWPFYDADDFHPAVNVEKMGRGEALTDADRMPWLRALRDLIARCLEERTSAVLACSALKAFYREVLTEGGGEAVVFVYLSGTRELIEARLAARHGHFFDASLLESQFAVLEEPKDAIVVEIAGEPEALVARIQEALHRLEAAEQDGEA
ncbi:MAG: gluconokinase [Rhodothermales bacterium]